MRVVVITPPVPGVDLDLVKAHLRVDHDDDDTLLQAYIDAAVSALDGPGGRLDRSIWTQTLEARLDEFFEPIRLPYGPVASVTSVKYLDDDGAEQTLASSVYQVAGEEVLLAYDQSWPTLRGDREGVRVRYIAGTAEAPAAVTQALLLIVGDLYAFRETAQVGSVAGQIPFSATVDALLAPYRRWTV